MKDEARSQVQNNLMEIDEHLVPVGGAVARPAVTPERDMTLLRHPTFQ